VEKTAPVQVESTETVPAVEPPSPPVDSEEAKSDGEPGISGSEVEEPAAVSSEDAPDSSGNSPEEGDRGIIGDNPESRIRKTGLQAAVSKFSDFLIYRKKCILLIFLGIT
jgi:hypothetical protein